MYNRGLWTPCRRPTGRSQLLYRYIKATCAGHAGHQLHRNHACHNATLCSIGLHDDYLSLCKQTDCIGYCPTIIYSLKHAQQSHHSGHLPALLVIMCLNYGTCVVGITSSNCNISKISRTPVGDMHLQQWQPLWRLHSLAATITRTAS